MRKARGCWQPDKEEEKKNKERGELRAPEVKLALDFSYILFLSLLFLFLPPNGFEFVTNQQFIFIYKEEGGKGRTTSTLR